MQIMLKLKVGEAIREVLVPTDNRQLAHRQIDSLTNCHQPDLLCRGDRSFKLKYETVKGAKTILNPLPLITGH